MWVHKKKEIIKELIFLFQEKILKKNKKLKF